MNSALLNETQVAEQLGVSLATLRRRRSEGRPPNFLRIGTSVKYRPEDIDDFLEACSVGLQNRPTDAEERMQ
jgi:predicted DNA-binding transcriptional regulator AlpA